MKTLILLALALPMFGQQWFNETNGDTNCRASLVNNSPLQFSYFCGNARGATAGSYTAATTATALDVVTIGITGSLGGVTCMFSINATSVAQPVPAGGKTVPAGTISWQCAGTGQNFGNSATGPAAVAIQLSTPPPEKKGTTKK